MKLKKRIMKIKIANKEYLLLHVAQNPHLQDIQSTRQGLPLQKESIMNLISKTSPKITGSGRTEDLASSSTGRVEPWGKDYVDFLHINILYCGGMYTVDF